jgi:UDP-N-acetylglucosamine 2-epimerase (non-hydrolysing)
MKDLMRIALIAGARPNFVKIAALKRALADRDGFDVIVVNTGQHYDDEMSTAFLRELEIGQPDTDLNVGSASHAVQTARIMVTFDAFLDDTDIDLAMVVGDVNSTAACSLTAVKRSVPVAHVEAGLRSRDWGMPEEINRLVTDTLSSLLFTPSRDANENLKREGHSEGRIRFVGNVMVDTLLRFRERALESDVLDRLEVEPGAYAVLTLHRPRNVDEAGTFSGVLEAVERIARDVPVVYPMHPRSSKMMLELGLVERAESTPGLRLTGPMNYLEFIGLESRAMFVMTDSGGVQEETTTLGVPCLTLRPNTERPVTITEGTNRLVGTDPEEIVTVAARAMSGQWDAPGGVPELWDGHAAERIADVLSEGGFR